jgi:hypothetical protein
VGDIQFLADLLIVFFWHRQTDPKMGFAGFPQQEKRADVFSCLKQFDAQGNKKQCRGKPRKPT